VPWKRIPTQPFAPGTWKAKPRRRRMLVVIKRSESSMRATLRWLGVRRRWVMAGDSLIGGRLSPAPRFLQNTKNPGADKAASGVWWLV
jgi:hypothetical protein